MLIQDEICAILAKLSQLPFEMRHHKLFRLRGGGGDGGSTGAESRSTYLEMYAGKQHDKIDPEEERLARWTVCHFSGAPLHPPCVADQLGYLYNKEALITAMLTKTLPPELSHINGLKSLLNLKLEIAPNPGGQVRFTCPVTDADATGKIKFVAIRPSGLVVSDRALREFKTVVEEYNGGTWTAGDILPLNPPADEVATLRTGLARVRGSEVARKEKKRNKVGMGTDDVEVRKTKILKSCPEAATPEVWSSLFINEHKQSTEKGSDFLTRGGRGYVM